MSAQARTAPRRDLMVAMASLLIVAAWDVSGLDFALSHQFAASGAFVWRDNFLASRVLHDGGRWLAGVLLVALVVDAWRPLLPGPSRRARAGWLLVTTLLLAGVPALKRLSDTSCPWDIAGLGGMAPYVPHWLLGVVDGGPGHCFPSGHAVAAFAFFGVYFLWREHRPGLARAVLMGVLFAGALFGAAQLVRGAHFLSHTLWSAWLCWTGAALAETLLKRRLRGVPPPASAAAVSSAASMGP